VPIEHRSSHETRQQEGPRLHQPFVPAHIGPTQLLEQAAVEIEDNDYYDVDSNDEMDVDPRQSPLHARNQKDFSLMLALHRTATDDISLRRYDAFLYDGILDFYRPERVASPLRNPHTARVFAHFIHATGPGLSVFERHPSNTYALFSDVPVPSSQQSLWTYTLPMMGLHHQGLLHAMLALASLHIAKLQGASITPSLKHYAYALKSIHHCVGHPKKRHLMSTIAATLLLGYYEVMTADHLKWNSHLLGAKQLIIEIDLAGMAREHEKLKAERAAAAEAERKRTSSNGRMDYADGQLAYSHSFASVEDLPIDEGLVSAFVGTQVRYNEFGRVVEEGHNKVKRPCVSPNGTFDVEKFETLQDLFWWYCKQDVYQSLISGNPLL
jgi:hypothetical protein